MRTLPHQAKSCIRNVPIYLAVPFHFDAANRDMSKGLDQTQVSTWHRYRLVGLILASMCIATDGAAEENAQEIQPTPAAQGAAIKPAAALDAFAERLNFDGETAELVWLGNGKGKRIALYQAPLQVEMHGAVIVMLGSGKLLDQSEFARTIRHALPAAGWGTLVVQNENMAAGKSTRAALEQVQNTLTEALSYLSQQNYLKHVLVADGEIASLLWPVVQSQGIIGFVGMDLWLAESFEPTIPVLNIANRALPRAVEQAQKRFNRVKQKPTAPCEVYFYDGGMGSDLGYGGAISRRVRGWLSRQFLQQD